MELFAFIIAESPSQIEIVLLIVKMGLSFTITVKGSLLNVVQPIEKASR